MQYSQGIDRNPPATVGSELDIAREAGIPCVKMSREVAHRRIAALHGHLSLRVGAGVEDPILSTQVWTARIAGNGGLCVLLGVQ